MDENNLKPGDWICVNCNEINFARRNRCYKCDNEKHLKDSFRIINNKIEIIIGDITKLNVDAIVNAANKSLLGGGGVDGAIHMAAGPELLSECLTLGGCETGEAKITKGYNLPSKYVIHTVGPIWNGGISNENEQLTSCYENSLKLATENNIVSIAFPSISTGIYGYPLEKASEIALGVISNFIKTNTSIETIKIVCFGKRAFDIYMEKAGEILV